MTGDEFRKIREGLGLSRTEMAELLGLASSTVISNIELGIRNPSSLTVTILRALRSLPKKKKAELIALLREHKES